jgi:hypothetical protein
VCATNQNTEIITDANNSHQKNKRAKYNGQMSGNKMNSEFSFFSFPHPQTVTVRKKTSDRRKGVGKCVCTYKCISKEKEETKIPDEANSPG